MPAPLRDMPAEGIELVKSFEGIEDGDPTTVNIDPYIDPVGIWTIGWGHAIPAPGGGGWLRGKENAATARKLYPGGITRAQAETLLRADLLGACRDVSLRVKVPLTDSQFGALVSFTFNTGGGALGQSTLLKKLNAGDYAGAADQFLVWNKGKVNGVLVELRGLTRRRVAERALFLGLDWRAASAPAPRGRGMAPLAAKPAKKKAAKKKAAPKKTAAKKAKAPARTTRPTGLPPAPPAKRRRPRTAT